MGHAHVDLVPRAWHLQEAEGVDSELNESNDCN